ncbi:MAG: hypothetical protein IJ344_03825 [Clostridia bacterium]|nr:hypothetical protein [Clostridia bacterium]
MISKKQWKAVMKEYGGARNHFQFTSRAEKVLENKHLRAKEPAALTGWLLEYFKGIREEALCTQTLASAIDRYLQKTPTEDRTLHLCADCIVAAIMRYLYENKDKKTKQRAETLALSLFSLSLELDYKELFEKYSIVDKVLKKRNFLSYRESDKESREEIRRTVYRYAKAHKVSQAQAAGLIGEEFLEEQKKKKKVCFTALLISVFLFFLVIALVFCGLIPFMLLILPIFTLSYELVCTIAAFTVRPAPILKRQRGTIDHPVLTVVTVLLANASDVEQLGKRLEIMYHQNPQKNIYFGLLADFKDSKRAQEPLDELLEKKAVTMIEELNQKYPGRFCLFIRERNLCPGEKCYMGWERKRGALIELVRLMKGKRTTFRRIIAPKNMLTQCRYILTLDADTDLRIGAVEDLYAAMRHPHNRPVIKNGVVVKGYGVLQPRMVTGIDSAGQTPFSLLFSGSGGIDNYSGAVFDFYQSIFSRGAFCGKGMFDVQVFYEVIENAFPEGKILSHDLLEGTRLGCGYLSELALTDSTPATALSYFSRQHRWNRGDLQALPFAFSHLPFQKEKKKNPIDALSKFMIFSNVLRLLTPVFSLAALFFSTHLKESTCIVFLLFCFSYLLFPLICTVLRSVRFASRRFYSTVMQNVWQSITLTLFSFCSLAYRAQIAFDALIRVFYRQWISGKKLLEWVTAGEGERKYKNASAFMLLLLYFKKAAPSVLIGLLMMFFSVGGFVRLLGLSFVIYPLVAFFLSRPYKKQNKLSAQQKEQMISYAKDSFSYFERFVTQQDHYLPPDNYQELPAPRLARRTSPTNIALYLTSCLAMADLGARSEEEMAARIDNTVNTLIALPKYKGHLYNWYDTKTLDLLGTPYISTVDSGNLAIGLLAVKNGLLEMGERYQELAQKIETLLKDLDFSFLYNEKKGLLCIGFDTLSEKQSENCYDLLASEARSAYYYAVAMGQIPKDSWFSLSRPISASGGYIGLYSWSGTAFEYFMPPLFLPVFKNTLLYEALCFAFFEQERARTKGLWGRSESGYFAFDTAMNYQYRAFGCKSLALDPIIAEHDVIAPYASFLGFCISPTVALQNLKKLKNAGLYGNCGFYEAIDFTGERVGKGNAVIRSYMSHHVGMSITACANGCLDGIFIKRTMRDLRMRAAQELLLERVPADAPVSRNITVSYTRPQRNAFALPARVLHHESLSGENALIYKGSTGLLSSDNRGIALSFEQYCITPPLSSIGPFPKILLKTDKEVIDLLSVPFLYDGRGLIYHHKTKTGKVSLSALVLKENALLFRLHMQGSQRYGIPLFFLPLALCKKEEWITHPAFTGLSVESRYEENNQILYFKKRPSRVEDAPLIIGFSLKEPFDFVTKKEDIPTRERSFTEHFSPSCGPCRKPIALLRGQKSTKEECSWHLLTVFGRSEQEVRTHLLSLKSTPHLLKKVKPLRHAFADANDQTTLDRTSLGYCSLLLEGMLHARKRKNELPCYPIHRLWSYGISGDLPIFAFVLPGEELQDSQKKILYGLLKAHAYLAFGGIQLDLVFIRREREQYFSPGKEELTELIRRFSGTARLSRKGGIHLLFDQEAKQILPSFCTVFLCLSQSEAFQTFQRNFRACLEKEHALPAPISHTAHPAPAPANVLLPLPAGYFSKEGFMPKKERTPYAPFSHVYCSHQFGTLLTDRSLGFTWFRNAGEMRLTPFSGNEDCDLVGERLYLSFENRSYDAAAHAQSTVFSNSYARYDGQCGALDYSLFVGCHPKLPLKIVLLRMKNRSPLSVKAKAEYRLIPCLSKLPDGMICEKELSDTVFFKRTTAYSAFNPGMYLWKSANETEIASGKESETLFLLGTVHLNNDRCYYHALSKIRNGRDALACLERYGMEVRAFQSAFHLKCADLPLCLLFNDYLPMQTRNVRLFARTGFYQPGGAYGFRDQFQDALCLLDYDEDLLLAQIYRCAAHQYYSGDVQHWWHTMQIVESKGDAGVRTECSDDLLWLPFACARYMEHTKSTVFLEKQIAYLSSAPLRKGEEQYEIPEKTSRKESLYAHCIRALDLVNDRRSPRGLCMMGSCDWNDGLSAVRGESVWLTQFYLFTLRLFSPYMHPDDQQRFLLVMKELQEALEQYCFKDGQYLRAFFENGEPLGQKGNHYCAIDLLPQAFAVFLDPNAQKAKQAIATAYDALWEKEHQLFRLFAPGYDSGLPFPGYLGGYCPGFRENGGQYTHGAVWGAMALLMAGQEDKGYEVLSGLNPIRHWQREHPVYALEPYAMAGDVYFAKGFEGRGGWSQYTGSAGWYLHAILTVLLGYREEGDHFTLHPHLCKEFSSFELTVNKKQTVYHLQVSLGEKACCLLDGTPHDAVFFFDKKEHNVKMVLQKKKK